MCVFDWHISNKMVLAPGKEFVRTQRRTCLRRSVEIPDIITNHLKRAILEASYWLQMILAKGEACHSFWKISQTISSEVLQTMFFVFFLIVGWWVRQPRRIINSNRTLPQPTSQGLPLLMDVLLISNIMKDLKACLTKCLQDVLTHNANTFCFGFHHSLHED